MQHAECRVWKCFSFFIRFLKIVLRKSSVYINFIVSRIKASYSKFKSYPVVWLKSCYSYSKMCSNLWKKILEPIYSCGRWAVCILRNRGQNYQLFQLCIRKKRWVEREQKRVEGACGLSIKTLFYKNKFGMLSYSAESRNLSGWF